MNSAAAPLHNCSPFLPPTTTKFTPPRRVSCFAPHYSSKCRREYTSVMIVPTGVGAAIGGFAGDALPIARAMSSVVDCLITHPNVLNAAMLYWPLPNALYVEGYALDRFAEGLWGLQPVHQNKVGLVLDAGIEEELRIRHLQVADATRASLGLPVLEYIVTDAPLEVEKWVNPKTGQSTGRIKRPGSLLRAVQTLIRMSQVNAVAVVGRFPDDDVEYVDDYRQGKIIDADSFGILVEVPLGQWTVQDSFMTCVILGLHGGIDLLAGVEAVISHLVVKEFRIPCAHAPAMLPLPLTSSLCPRSAAEEIGYTFLPCVLAGLCKAPQYSVNCSESLEKGSLLASDVDSVVLPVDACGGDGSLAFARRKINKPLIITVEENETVLDDTPEKLQIETITVSNYWEAIGVIAAHKAGIDPYSLRRNRIGNLRGISSVSANGFAVSNATTIN